MRGREDAILSWCCGAEVLVRGSRGGEDDDFRVSRGDDGDFAEVTREGKGRMVESLDLDSSA